MEKNLLLITGQHEFEQLLRLTLDEFDSRYLHYAKSNEEARQLAEEYLPGIILLDSASIEDAAHLAEELLENYPGSKLILAAPANTPQQSSPGQTKPDRFLSRPFLKEDLLEMILELAGIEDVGGKTGAEEAAPEPFSALLADLKDQLESDPDAFPEFAEETALSLEDELEQILSDHRREKHSSELDPPGEDEKEVEETFGGSEPDLSDVEDTAVVKLQSLEAESSMPSIEEESDDDEEILQSVLLQLAEQSRPASEQGEDIHFMEDILNEDAPEQVDPELDALLNEMDQEDEVLSGADAFFDDLEGEEENTPTLVPPPGMDEADEMTPPETILKSEEDQDEPEYAWELNADIPLPEISENEPEHLSMLRELLIQNQPQEIQEILADISEKRNLYSILLFNQGRIQFSGKAFDKADHREIENILQQAGHSEGPIDLARFLKLGESQEKYLLYAASIRGAFGLCTINHTSKPLSEIRSETLQMAQALQLESSQIPDMDLQEEETTAPALQDEAPAVQAIEETPHTTLDDLLSDETLAEEPEAVEELGEWVREVPDAKMEQEGTGDIEELEAATEIEIEEHRLETELTEEEAPERDGEIEDVVTDDRETSAEEAETLEEDFEEAPVFNQYERPEQENQVEAELNEKQPELPEKSVSKIDVQRLSKTGQGRFKVRKSSQEIAGQHQWESQVAVEKSQMVFKPFDYGQEKSAGSHLEFPQEIGRWTKAGDDWKPAGRDPLSNIRHRLKNQKAPGGIRLPKIGSTAQILFKQGKSLKQEILPRSAFTSLAVGAGTVTERTQENTIETDSIQPLAPPEELEWQEEVSVEQPQVESPLNDTPSTREANELNEDWFAPPETLSENEQTAEYEEDLDDILAGIMDDMEEDDSGAELPPAPSADVSEAKSGEDSRREEQDDDDDEVVIIEENLSLLKELAEDMPFEDMEIDEDADTFFEAYMSRAGEQIEDEASGESGPLEKPSEKSEGKQPEDLSTEAVEETSLQETPESGTPSEEDAFSSAEDVDTDEFVRLLREKMESGEPEVESLDPPDIDDAFSRTVIQQQETPAVPVEEPPQESGLHTPPADEEEMDWGEFPSFSEDLEEDEILKSLEAGSSPESWETIEPGSPTAATHWEEPELPAETDTEPVEEKDEKEIEDEVRKILAEVFEEPEETPAKISTEQPDDTDEESETVIPLPAGMTGAEEENHEGEPWTLPDEGSTLDDSLLPWETEEDGEDNIEATPKPSSLIEEDQSADLLIDLLADTRLDSVNLNFDQPLYTCILVPELTEFSLNSQIASRIKEWLPRLSRVFGWQFVNVLVQPTYLQWTVRVPSGTSQGSIVRKVRQQTSLRIFEEFPELKQLSLSGNFWAKGYLVVSGSNPPPAEFLDDFIQKNRRPKGIFGS